MKEIFRNKKILVIAGSALIIIALVITLLIIAPWKQTFTVTFESNGGGDFAAIEVKKGMPIAEEQLPQPIKMGGMFGGWCTDEEGKVFYVDQPVERDMTLYASYVTPNDIVTNDLTEVLVGDVTQDFAIAVRSEEPITAENLDEYIGLEIDFGKHADGTEIKLSVSEEGSGIYTITANYAKPGSYRLYLNSDKVTFHTEDETVKSLGITEAAKLIVFTVPGESYSNVVYKDNVNTVEDGSILAYNGNVACVAGATAYQAGDIISLPVNDKSDYYTIVKTVSAAEAKAQGLDIPIGASSYTCYEIRLSETDEVFDELDAYLRADIEEKDFIVDSDSLKQEILQQLSENTQVAQLTNMMFAAAQETSGYQTLSVQQLGSVVNVTPLAQTTQPEILIDIAFNQVNPSYFEHMTGFDSDSGFLRISIDINSDIPVTNAQGKGLVVSANINLKFWVHMHIDVDAAGITVINYDASLTTLTRTLVEFELAVQTADGTGKVDLTGEFQDLLEAASQKTVDGDGTFFDIYNDIMGDSESERLTLLDETVARPSYVVGVVEISFPVDLVLSVDLHAALNAEMDIMTGNRVGIRGDTKNGYETYSYHADPYVRFYMMVQGHVNVRAGIELNAQLNFVGLERLGHIGLNAEVGPYVDIYGFYYLSYTKKGGTSTSAQSGAYYMEVGIYLDIDAEASILTSKFTASLYDKEWALASLGNKNVVFDIESNVEQSVTFGNDGLEIDPSTMVDVLYYDLTEPMSDKNPYEALEVNNTAFAVSTSDQRLVYDPSYGRVYYKGPANVERVDAHLILQYRNSSTTVFSALTVKIPITYWNDDVLGDYDPSKEGQLFTATYLADGVIVKTELIPYGHRLTGSGEWDVVSAMNSDTPYSKLKWEHGNPVVAKDMSFEGTGEPYLYSYTFVVVDENGEIVEEVLTAPYGEIPDTSAIVQQNPAYHFEGWNEYNFWPENLVDIEPHYKKGQSKTYYARYDVTGDSVTFTFDVGNGTILDNQNQPVTETTAVVWFDEANKQVQIPYSAIATDENKKFVGWMLNGTVYTWADPIPAEAGDVFALTAVYENKSTRLTLTDSGKTTEAYRELYETMKLPDPSDTTKSFLGWRSTKDGKLYGSGEDYYVTAEDTLTAVYEEPVKTYTVTFDLNGGAMSDGRTVVTVTVQEGEYAPDIGTPILAKDDGKDYVFVEWTPAFAPITKDTTYTAVYEEVVPVAPPVVTGVHYKVENGVLTVYGTGKIGDYLVDYTGQNVRPWDSYYNSITKVVVEDGITYIGNHAFSYLPNLTTVEIADSVTSAGFACFMDCPKLTSVKLSDNMVCNMNTYDQTGGNDFSSMFSGCSSLKSITLPTGFTRVPMQMFHSCTSLATVNLPSKLEIIEWGAFGNCTSLRSITLPDTVTTIEMVAFSGCTALESINLRDDMVIDESAFEGCTKLLDPVL